MLFLAGVLSTKRLRAFVDSRIVRPLSRDDVVFESLALAAGYALAFAQRSVNRVPRGEEMQGSRTGDTPGMAMSRRRIKADFVALRLQKQRLADDSLTSQRREAGTALGPESRA